MIDYLPSVRAYVESRIKQPFATLANTPYHQGRLDELELLIKLIDGLQKQGEIVSQLKDEIFKPQTEPET